MRQFFCEDKRLVETVDLYNHSVGEYLASLSLAEVEFASVWLDYTGTFYKEQKFNPRNDIINLFEKQLLLDGGIFALTLFYGRGKEDRWYQAVDQIPIYAKNFGYELKSLCGLDYTYACRDSKLSSSFDYHGTISLLIFRVHKIEPEEEEEEEKEKDEEGDEYDFCTK